MQHLITFIGFGEAAFSIASGLTLEGVTDMYAYDVMQDTEPMASCIRSRAEVAGVQLKSNVEAACRGAEFVLSLTSATECINAANSVLPYLKVGQVYVDMNSAAPTAMTRISQLPWAEGVQFCDAALMGSVPQGKHKTKMLLAGSGSQKFYNSMKPFNLNLTILDAQPGGASAIKMFKSVFSKGVPQLLMECLLPAARYGVLDYVVSSISNPFPTNVEETSKMLIYRTIVHARRRSGEMKDVSDTIEALGLDASMSRATEQKLKYLSLKNYAEELPPEKELSLHQLIFQLMKDA